MLMFQTIDMKKITILFAVVLCSTMLFAQQPGKFDPRKFQADMEQFITTEAGLTPQEAQHFFPMYREMMQKQRLLFDQMRRNRQIDVNDEAACLKSIKKADEIDLEIKQLQQNYHQKFMQVLSATKLFRVMRAEEKFHRQAFRNAAHMKKP